MRLGREAGDGSGEVGMYQNIKAMAIGETGTVISLIVEAEMELEIQSGLLICLGSAPQSMLFFCWW